MADQLLDNTKAIEEMVAAMRQQVPVGGTPYSNSMQRSLDELTSRLDKLAELYRMGAKPGSLATQAARASVVEQQNYAAERFGSLTKPEQAAFMPQMNTLQGAMKQESDKELEYRKQLNRQLLDGAYSLGQFMRAASTGSIPGMAGAAAGAIGGATAGALVGGIGEAIVNVINRMREATSALEPALESTRKTSEQLEQAARARLTGTNRAERAAAYEQQLSARRQIEDARRHEAAGNPNTDPVVRARIAWNNQLIEAHKQRLREWGIEVPEFKENVFMPNRARFTGGEEYYQSLGNAALQASGQQADNELLRLQMEANGLLVQISNRLDRAFPPVFGP